MRHFALQCLLLYCFPLSAADDYQLGPDSLPQDGVPQGTVTQGKFISQKVYPGTERDYWIYVPKQYDPQKPACLMVFQDGGGYVSPKGHSRVPTVFDNLIHKGEMPVTIGVFINPGVIPAAVEGGDPRKNRSFEYDTVSDQCGIFVALFRLRPEQRLCRSSSVG